MIEVCYAVQACDTKSSQGEKRYCGDDRTLLGKKSIKSLLLSIKNAIDSDNGKQSIHRVKIFADNCSLEYNRYIKECISQFSSNQLIIEHDINNGAGGLMPTLRKCWTHMKNSKADIVYQVQDDYLFVQSAIEEMIDILFQIINDCRGTHPIVVPFNDPMLWKSTYLYMSVPMVFAPGKKRYWIQAYDIPCTFMTTSPQFNAHWDIYEKFLSGDPRDPKLEPTTVNRIFIDRGVLGVRPVESVAIHAQGENVKEPYLDWKKIWDSIEV